MEILAAIDLKNGKFVRLRQGDPDAETVYGDDPAGIAEQWAEMGTDWIHVVNLDGAFGEADKAAKNVEALRAILDRVTTPVQFGGGLRSPQDVEQALEMGVSRVVIGSMAAKRPQAMRDLLARFGPERIVLGLDVRDGKVATHGWQQVSDLDAATLARQIHEAGLAHIVYTDISRDGMLTGLNIEATVALAQAGNPPDAEHRFTVIASGGVASLDDVRRVKAVEDEGVEGLIIGKALYTDRVDLAEALQIARGQMA